MPTPRLSDELAQQAADAYREAGTKAGAARLLNNMPEKTFKNRLERAAERGMLGTKPVLPGFRITKTTAVTNEDGDVVREFIQQKSDAGEPFEIPEGHQIKGISALVGPDGRISQQWIKTREGELSAETQADLIKAAFADWTPPAFIALVPGETNADTLTVYPIADLHLGLRAVADESGTEFDLAIATDRFRDTTARLFDRSPDSDTALILQLGDWTHVDDDLALTPTSKNTLQVSDRLLDIVKCGVRIMIDYIYHALRKHRRVVVKVLKGNHDLNAWIALYVALCEHFRDNERVTIDGGAADYWFFRFGSTLLGAHHGHRLKPEEMAGAMAMECREDWGETLYRLFLHGHLHHRRVVEVLGVAVECVRTLAEDDAHHAGKYRAGKSLISITIHKDHGEDGRVQINLPPVRKRAANAG